MSQLTHIVTDLQEQVNFPEKKDELILFETDVYIIQV